MEAEPHAARLMCICHLCGASPTEHTPGSAAATGLLLNVKIKTIQDQNWRDELKFPPSNREPDPGHMLSKLFGEGREELEKLCPSQQADMFLSHTGKAQSG